MKVIPTATSPRPASCPGAAPLRVYSATFLWLALRRANAAFSPKSWRRVGGRAGDQTPVARVGDVLPRPRNRQVLLLEQPLVQRPAQDAGVQRNILAGHRLAELLPQVVPGRGPDELGEPFFVGDDVRIAGAAEPDVERRVLPLGAEPRQPFAGAQPHEVDLKARGPGKLRLHGVTPGRFGAAQEGHAASGRRGG